MINLCSQKKRVKNGNVTFGFLLKSVYPLYKWAVLKHLDAEVVIWFSSAYGGTPESQSAPKNTHKN